MSRERKREVDRQRERERAGGWGNLKKEQQDIGKKEVNRIRNERNT